MGGGEEGRNPIKTKPTDKQPFYYRTTGGKKVVFGRRLPKSPDHQIEVSVLIKS